VVHDTSVLEVVDGFERLQKKRPELSLRPFKGVRRMCGDTGVLCGDTGDLSRLVRAVVRVPDWPATQTT